MVNFDAGALGKDKGTGFTDWTLHEGLLEDCTDTALAIGDLLDREQGLVLQHDLTVERI